VHNLPFGRPGRFWRGNLHTHSTHSDGALPPDQISRLYQEAGYDFVAITDHFRAVYGFPLTDTQGLRTSTFTTLLGAELHAPRTGARPGRTPRPAKSCSPPAIPWLTPFE
jgi:hypothetical protein